MYRKHNETQQALFERDGRGRGNGNIVERRTCSRYTVHMYGISQGNALILFMYGKSKINK
jgi:hypothetical protein